MFYVYVVCVNLVISRFDDLENENCDDVGMGKLETAFLFSDEWLYLTSSFSIPCSLFDITIGSCLTRTKAKLHFVSLKLLLPSCLRGNYFNFLFHLIFTSIVPGTRQQWRRSFQDSFIGFIEVIQQFTVNIQDSDHFIHLNTGTTISDFDKLLPGNMPWNFLRLAQPAFWPQPNWYPAPSHFILVQAMGPWNGPNTKLTRFWLQCKTNPGANWIVLLILWFAPTRSGSPSSKAFICGMSASYCSLFVPLVIDRSSAMMQS